MKRYIKPTHKTTFYPIQYDNLNWLEFFGEHTRLAFPFQSIEKLRARPLEEGEIDFFLTYVYHLFPNVVVSTSPGQMGVMIAEPETLERTRMVNFMVGPPRQGSVDGQPATAPLRPKPKKGPDYQLAQAEDQAMVTSAQRGLATGANEFLEFGLFEAAIVRFYERLHAALS